MRSFETSACSYPQSAIQGNTITFIGDFRVEY
jgi:hypothetical protein